MVVLHISRFLSTEIMGGLLLFIVVVGGFFLFISLLYLEYFVLLSLFLFLGIVSHVLVYYEGEDLDYMYMLPLML